MKKLLDDDELRRRIAEAGKQSALKRKWGATAQQNADLYRTAFLR